jgi:predicted transcriptional regulator
MLYINIIINIIISFENIHVSKEFSYYNIIKSFSFITLTFKKRNNASDLNFNRNIVLKYINNKPGCTVAQIANKTGINRETVRYHLYKLGTTKKIEFRKKGKYLAVLPNKFVFEGNADFFIFSDIDRIILLGIAQEPGITNKELSLKLNLNKSTLNYYLNKFSYNKFIVSTKKGKSKKYFLCENFSF